MWKYNYICHHGIKGQKWGVRRYQNEDGSLTELGKKRLRINNDTNIFLKDSYAQLARSFPNRYKKISRTYKHFNQSKFIDYQKKELDRKASERRKLSDNLRNKDLKDAYDAWTSDEFNNDQRLKYETFMGELGRLVKMDGPSIADSDDIVNYDYSQLAKAYKAIKTAQNLVEKYSLWSAVDNGKLNNFSSGKDIDDYISKAMKINKEYQQYKKAEESLDDRLIKKLVDDMGFLYNDESKSMMRELALKSKQAHIKTGGD